MRSGSIFSSAMRAESNLGPIDSAHAERAPGAELDPCNHDRTDLRVAINASLLRSPPTGIGNYVLHLGAALQARGDIDLHSFCGYSWRHHAPIASEGGPAGTSPARTRALRAISSIPLKRELLKLPRRLSFRHGLRRRAIELYHEPNYIPLSYDVPVVTTVHDLSWVHYPEFHPSGRIRWLERGFPALLARTSGILVDSEFVRDELVAIFGVAMQRVTVAHLGVSSAFRPRSSDETAVTLGPLGLKHGHYLLSVGTIEPRKNIGHALTAFAHLPAALRDRFPLVIAGASGWRAEELRRELRLLANAGQIRFLGRAPAADLPNLYSGATAFIFPSLYEGFGLPPLEAMASGVPVLASDRAALREVVAEACMLIDPEQPLLTTLQLAEILEDSGLRADLAKRGESRARSFTWTACAETTVRAYRHALARPAA